MKKVFPFIAIMLLFFASCDKNRDLDDPDLATLKNAERVLGLIDAGQDWISIKEGAIHITADAPLVDVAKVQILMKSPFAKGKALILAEENVTKDAEVTISYQVPVNCKRLIAVCVSSKGAHYSRGFDFGTEKLSFGKVTGTKDNSDAETIDLSESPEQMVYTMCFECRPFTADYDMNDVVLKGRVIDNTHVEMSIVACGDIDQLILHGINGKVINSQTEIHALFGQSSTFTYVNTRLTEPRVAPVVDVVEKAPGETLEHYMNNISLENLTTGNRISTNKAKGMAPNAIIIPYDFLYPVEGTSIINAYSKFKNWVHDANTEKDWFLYSLEGAVFQ